MKVTAKILIVFFLSFILGSIAWSETNEHDLAIKAVTLGKYQVARNQGVVQELDRSKNTIMINATKYYLGQNVKVHSKKNEFGSINNLSKGSNITFMTSNNDETITEIWIVPKGSVKLN